MIDSEKCIKRYLIIFSLYISPFILLGKMYRDDYARSVNGYFMWSWDGRPLADLFIYIINMGGELTPISPFSYVISILVCSFTCFIISKLIIEDTTLPATMAVTILFISPFYLQNLSYNYDSVTMCIAIMLCAIPYITKRQKHSIILSFIFPCAALMTYQAAIPVFFALAILSCIMANSDVERRIIFYRCVSASLSVVFYVIAIAPLFVRGPYSKTKASLIDVNSTMVSSVIGNLKNLISLIGSLTDYTWIISFSACFTLLLTTIILLLLKKGGGFWKYFSILSSTGLFAATSLMFFLIKNPVYMPRVMIWFNALCMVACVSSCLIKSINYRIRLFIVGIPFVYCIVSANNFYNAAKLNKEKQLSIASSIYSDTRQISDSSKIIIYWGAQSSPAEARIRERFKFIKQILNSDYGWWNVSEYLNAEYPTLQVLRGRGDFTRSDYCGIVLKKWNGYYTITKKDENTIVIFKDISCI